MPELPEVEGAAAHLRRLLRGRRITAFTVLDPEVLRLDAGDGSAIGAPEVTVGRRAKYLVLQAGSEAWMIHFRMTGELRRGGAGGRARWTLDDGSTVVFEDPRRLGEIWRLRADNLPAFFAARQLGPEPWPEPRDGPWWRERLKDARSALKPALMDQARVAGLGNIAAAEICWRAGLSPLRPASGLSDSELDNLATAARAFLTDTVAACSQEEVRYVNRGGPNPFSIYQRGTCPRCNIAVTRDIQASRSTWWCPGCQR